MTDTMREKISLSAYILFLLATFSFSALLYFGIKATWGIAAALLAVFLLGQGHYAMAYLWSVPAYRTAAVPHRSRNLAVFSILALAALLAFYIVPFLPFAYAVLFVIVLGVFHNFRDYEFFFRQMMSGYRDARRSPSLTFILSGLFLLVYFGTLFADPAHGMEVFGGAIPREVFAAGVAFAFALLGTGLILFVRGKGFAPLLADAGIARSFAFFLPAPLVGLLARSDPADLAYLFTAWHFALWLGYIPMKVHYESARDASRQEEKSAGMLDAILRYWRRDIFRFAVVTLGLYAILIALPLAFWYAGWFRAAADFIRGSFFWGISGFIFFSFSHIVFTALPRLRRAPSPLTR